MARRFSKVCFVALGLLVACTLESQQSNVSMPRSKLEAIERLVGEIDVTPTALELDRGRVLMSYSGCFACHKESDRKRGPALSDIAARYPMNSAYIDVLAKRIIHGARGAWGNAVMLPHPNLPAEDAKTMVRYILSLHGKTP